MRSKKYKKALDLIEKDKIYEPAKAIEIIKKTSGSKFDSTVELHLRLGIDPKKGDQQVRGTLNLPHGAGKTKVVAAFVETAKEKEAKQAGADIIGSDELIAEIKQTGKCNFSEAVATPQMMPKLASIAKILGPKGLMPSPKSETVGTDITSMIKDIKRGKVSYKNDDTGNIHLAIGKTSFDNDKLIENFTSAIDSINKNRPSGAKGTYLKTVYLSSTMGPSIEVRVE